MSVRLGRRGLARLATELSERDFQILHAVASHRFLSAKQIERLHFHNHATPLTAARICRRVLARLTDARVLDRLSQRTVGGVHAGSASFIYCLGPAGRRLRREGGVRVARTPTPAFLEHTLAVADAHIELVEAVRSGRLELVSVEVEPASWRRYLGSGGARERLKPDLFVISALGEYEYCWFVEVDRGREGPSALVRKCRQYESYWRSGREQQRLGTFPLVVWSVPDARRAEAVERVIGQARGSKRELFQVVTSAQLVELFAGGAQ